MKIGVVFPQNEYGNDPAAIKDYAQATEQMGYAHIIAYDHVLGANPDRPGGWTGPYTHETPFHEPFVLFGFMAAVTERIEFCPGVLILPQRQTALVAKQASTLDVLCGGRFRLGVGLGWNEVEYEALNEDFHTRGRRIEEQVAVLRELWTKPLVTIDGRWHHIPDAGLKPLPVQQPIPIWFGGSAEAALRRIARLADGWLVNTREPEATRAAVDRMKGYVLEAGRSLDAFGLEGRIPYGSGKPEDWRAAVEFWQALGATHLSINTMRHGFATPQAHLDALASFATALELA
jgi:probable F420-dependent oxidoreductase